MGELDRAGSVATCVEEGLMDQRQRRNLLWGFRARGLFAPIVVLVALFLAAPQAHGAILADFVFVIDESDSMQSDLEAIADAVTFLPIYLSEEGLNPDDIQYAVVTFGTNRRGADPIFPRLDLPLTDSVNELEATMEAIVARERIQFTESGTEGIDFALDQLVFRPEAIRNVILITDEDDDRPASIEGDREPPRNWPPDDAETEFFQQRLNITAAALVADGALLNLVINPLDRPTLFQYGDPTATVLDPEGRLDIDATLAMLQANGYEQGLQGQVLSAGIVARAFDINAERSDPAAFWEEFFRAKAQEVIPEPATFGLLLPALLGTVLLRRRR
jgi:hypothetical protein